MYRTALCSYKLLILFLILLVGATRLSAQTVSYTVGSSSHGNASVLSLSQTRIFVSFTGAGGATGVQFNGGAPNLALWTVKIGATTVPVTAAVIGGFTVILTFDATAVAGHGAGRPFIMPGETMTVAYSGGAGAGAVQAVPGANFAPAFAADQSLNTVAFTCSDLLFYQQGDYATVDQCAPVVMNFHQFQYRLSLRFRNSTQYDLTKIFYKITWGDPSAVQNVNPYVSDGTGLANPAFIENTGFGGNPGIILTARPTHNYPATTTPAPDICSWDMSLLPSVQGVVNCPSQSISTIFATYDTDNANTGTLNMPFNPPGVGETSDRVCLGNNVNMHFTDNTLLNCRLAAPESTVPNDLARSIRIVYGSTNYGAPGNIPDIRVTVPAILGGGTTVLTSNVAGGGVLIQPGNAGIGIPAGGFAPLNTGSADFNGVITLPQPVTVATALTYMGKIFTTAATNQAVGQRFYIRLDYWDVCNPYSSLTPTNPAPVSIQNYVEIVTKPVPLTAAGAALCFGTTTPVNFTVGGTVAGYTAINFYNKNPQAGGATQMQTGMSPNFSSSNYNSGNNAIGANPGGGVPCTGPGCFSLSKTNGAYYSVWATQVVGGTNSCESTPIEVVIVQTPDLSGFSPATPTTAGNQCNGTGIAGGANNVTYNEATSATAKTIPINTYTDGVAVSLTTENAWSQTWGAGVTFAPSTGNSTVVSYNLAVQPPTFQTGNVGVTLRFQAQNITVTSPIAAPFTPPAYTIAVPTAGAGCVNGPVNLSVDVYGQTVGGSVTPNQTICNGTSTATMTLAGQRGSIIRWERTFNAGVPTIIANTTTTYSETPPNGAGTYTYYAVVQNKSGGPCAIVNSAAATITVNPVPPKPTISQGGGSTGLTICQDGVQQTVLQSDNVGGFAASYLWFKNGVSTGVTAATITLNTVAQSGSYTVQTIGAGPSFCPSAISNAVPVTINPLPTATVTGGGSVCSGTPAPDIVWTLVGTAPFTLSYTDGTTTFGPTVVAGNTYTVTAPVTAGNYKLTSLKDNNSCLANAAGLGGTANVTIQAVPPPTVQTFTATTAVCDVGAGTNPPDALLNLLPDAVQNYSITYQLKNLNTNVTGAPFTNTYASDAAGIVTLTPTYAQMGSAAEPLGYQIIITAIFNTTTLCAGAVPINGPTLIINPTPGNATGPVNSIACSSGGGQPLNVNDPGAGFQIMWSTTSPAFTNAVPGSGAASGTRNKTFTPTSSATATFFAFVQSTVAPTNCLSASGLAVTQTQDLLPAAAAAGPDQPNLCGTTATMAATAVNNGGTGKWTITGTGTITSPNSPTTTVTGLVQNPPAGLPVSVTLHWTVTSALNTCAPTSDDVVLTTNPLPTSNIITPQLCDDITGAPLQTANVDLTTYNALVTNAPTVQWYSSPLRTPPFLVPAPVTINNGDIYYFTATAAGPTFCVNTGQTTFTVNNLPAAVDKSSEYCENSVGFGSSTGIDLTALEMGAGGVTNGGTAATRDVEWYEDNAGALGALIAPGAAVGQEKNYTISATKLVHAKVIDLTSPVVPKCFDIADVTLKFKKRPADNPIVGNATVCTGSSIQIYQIDPALNSYSNTGVSPTVHTYTWTVSGTADFTVVAGGGTNSANFFVLIKFPGPLTGNVNFTVFETVDGCTGNTKNFSVTVAGAPAALAFNAPETQVCKGDTKTYSLTSTNPSSTYTWNVQGGTIIGPSVGLGLTTIGINWGVLTAPQPTISVTETSSSGCPGTPASIQVFLNDVPAMTSSNTYTMCSGFSPATAPLPLNFTATIPSTFGWTVASVTGAITSGGVPVAIGSGGTGNITQVLDNVSGSVGSVTYQVTPTESNLPTPPSCTGLPQTVVVTVNPRPVLVAGQAKTICSGQSVGYEILLTPANLPAGTVFTWPDPDGGGPASSGNVPMGAAGTLHIVDILTNATNAPVTTNYVVTATSGGGCVSSTTTVAIKVEPQPAAVITNTAPLIPNGSNTNITITSPTTPSVPANLKFDVAVSSTNTGATGGTAFSALTTQSFPLTINGTLTNSSNAFITVTYTVTPKLAGCTSGPVQTTTVIVEPTPTGVISNTTPVIGNGDNVSIVITSPTSPTIPGNLTFDLAVSSTNPGATGGSASTPLVNQNFPLTINGPLTNSSNSAITVTYTVTPKYLGSPSGPVQTTTVVVEPTPQTTIVNSTATVCQGGNVNIIIGSPTNPSIPANLKFDLTVSSTNAGATGGTAFANLSNQSFAETINGTLTNSSNSSLTVTFTVVPKLTGHANGPPQFTTVVVEPTATASVNNTAGTICNGDNVNIVITSSTVPSIPGNSKFDVAVSSNNAGATSGSAFTSLSNQTYPLTINGSLSNSSSTTITVTFTITPKLSGCASGPVQTTSVVVEPTPQAAIANTTPLICNGGNINLNITSPTIPSIVANLHFDVAVASTNAGATGGTAFTALSNQTLPLPITGTLTNSSTSAITVTYTITPKLAGCPNGPVQTTTVQVEPTPQAAIANGAPSICNGGNVNLSISSSTAPTTPANLKFDVAVTSTNAGATGGSAFASLTNQSFPLAITGNLTNSSNSAVTVTYTVTPKLTGCANGTPQVATVVVDPTPTAAINNTTPTVCDSDPVNIALTSPSAPSVPASLTFDLTVASNDAASTGGTAFTALNNQSFPFTINGTLTNSSDNPVTITFTLTPKLAGCASGAVKTTTVIIEPSPDAIITNSLPTICNNGNINLKITTTTTPSIPANLRFDVAVSSTNGPATGGTAFVALANQNFPATLNGSLTNSSDANITVTYTITPKLVGCTNGAVQTTTVVVEPTPQTVVTNSNPTVCNGGNVNIQITSPSTPSVPGNLKFDVAVSSTNAPATGGSAFATLTGQTFPMTLTGVLTNSSNTNQTVTFAITPTLNGCANGPVKTTTVVVEPTPQAVITDTAPTICNGGNVALVISSPTVPTIPANLKFDVAVSSTNAGATGGGAFNPLSSQNFPLTINGTLTNSSNAAITVTFSITPTLNGCANGPVVTEDVIVEPTPLAAITNTTALVCNGDDVSVQITSPTGPSIPTNLGFDVAVSSTNAGATGGTAFIALSNQSFPFTINGSLTNSSNNSVTVTFKVTPKLSGCTSGPTQITTVVVEPIPQTVISNTTPKVCNGGNVNISISSPSNPTIPGNLKFDVAVSSTNAGATGGTAFAPLANQSFPLLISGTLTNSSNATVTVTFTVTPKLNGCAAGPVQTTTVLIEPTPQAAINNTSPDVCAGGNVSVQITSPSTPSVPANLKFDVAVSSTNGAATGGSAFVPLSNQSFPLTINGVLTNTSNGTLTVTYTITPKLNGCANGPDQTTNVIVEPFPQAAINNTTPTVCNAGNVSIVISTPSIPTTPANLNFDVSVSSTNAGATGGTAFAAITNQAFPFTINGTLTNSSSSSVTVTYTVTPKLTGCIDGPIQTTTVVVEPTPQAVVTNAAPTVCNGGNVNLNITTLTSPSIPANQKFDVAVSSSDTPSTGGGAFTALTNQSFPLVITGILTNSSNNFITVTFTITPKLAGCVNGPVQTTSVVVEPTPQAAIANTIPTVCNGGNVSLNITSPSGPSVPANLKFDVAVTSTNSGATGGTAFTALANQSFPKLIAGTLTNSSNTSVTVTFTITPKLGGCSNGPNQTTTVVVDPTPSVALVNNKGRVCNNDSPDIDVTSPTTPSVPANLLFDVAVTSTDPPNLSGTASNNQTNISAPFSINAIDGTLINSSKADITVTYTITPKLNGCASGTPIVTTLILEPTPVVAAVNNAAAICSGGSPNISITSPVVPSVPADQTFDIGVSSSIPGNTGGTAFVAQTDKPIPFTLNSGTLTNSGTTDLTVTFTFTPKLNGCPTGTPVTANVVVHPIPVVSPTSGQICSNNAPNVTFGSAVAGSTFGWKVTAISGSTVTGIALNDTGSGTTVPNIIRNVTSAQAQITFTVTPTGPAGLGGCVGLPKDIIVKVDPEPVLLNPGLNVTACSDTNTGLVFATNGISVAATSYLITAFNPNGLTESVSNVIKSTSVFPATVTSNQLASEQFTNMTSAAVVVSYTVVPVGPAPGNCQGAPLVVTVTVNPEPFIVPGAVPVCSGVAVGAAITLNPGVGSVLPTQFELKKITNAANMPTGGSNAGLGTYNNGNFLVNDIYINTVDANSHDVIYEIVPITNGCRGVDAAGNGKMVTLTVNPAPDLLDNIGKTVCSGSTSGIVFSTRLLPVASAPADHYKLTGSVVAAGLVPVVHNNVFPRNGASNDIANEQFNNPTNGVLTVTYTVVPVTLAGCEGPAEIVTLTVEPAVTMIVPPNVSSCSDTPNSPNTWSIILDSNTTPSAGNITFDYTAVSNPAGAVSGFLVGQSSLPRLTAIADKLTNTSNNVASVIYTITPRAVGARNGAGCSAAAPTVVTVTVEPRPRLSVSPSTQAVCNAVAASMTLSSSTVPGTGTLQFKEMSAMPSDPSVTLLSAPKTIYLNGEMIADVWNNPTLNDQTITYTFRAQFSGGLGCQSDDIVVTLTVHPQPAVTASVQPPICGDGATPIDILLTPNIVGTVVSWTATVLPGGTVTGQAQGTGYEIYQTLKNTGFTPATVRYVITPKLGLCIGNPVTVDVQVDPIPDVLGITNTPVKVCYGGALNVPLSSSVSGGVTFNWVVDDPDNVGATGGSGSLINQTLSNPNASQSFITYTVTATGPGATACPSQPKNMTVIAYPQMNAQILNPATWLCKGSKDFLQIQLDGQAPFDLVYTDGTTNFSLTKVGNFKSIQIQPTVTTTYTLVSMTDASGVCSFSPTSSVTFTVGDTDPTFAVVGSASSCSPHQFSFSYNQKAGTEYTWRWGDGSADSVYVAATDVTGMVVAHGFSNSSPTSTFSPKVVLQTDLPAPFPGCFKSSQQTVSLLPRVVANVFADKNEICSGEQVIFTNQSFGATNNLWVYRLQGGPINPDQQQATKNATFTIVNNTVNNPQVYEVIYHATNASGCPAKDTVIAITVYRGVTASYDIGPGPWLLIGGHAPVTFTNTSVPVDPAFRYDWDFALDATPATATDNGTPGSYLVDYTSQGPRDATLIATNVAAEAAGLSCVSTFTKTIPITVPPLIVDITVIPPAACFPADIVVTKNQSTGDVMLWKLYDQNGSLVLTSSENTPTFHLTNPGEYTMTFQTSDHLTGQTQPYVPDPNDPSKPPLKFVIYAPPIASFDVRPLVVYVPDTELTTFNFSTQSNGTACSTCGFLWDFGDGNGGFTNGTTATNQVPTYSYKIEGEYDITLVVSEDHGDAICSDTTTKKVTAKQGGLSKVPNAFTPNPDGPNGGYPTNGSFNDVFLPIVKGVEEFNMQIYDRWGNLIFESNNSTQGWDGYKDGKLMPAGVYVYKLTIRLSDNQRSTQIGDVTMIR